MQPNSHITPVRAEGLYAIFDFGGRVDYGQQGSDRPRAKHYLFKVVKELWVERPVDIWFPEIPDMADVIEGGLLSGFFVRHFRSPGFVDTLGSHFLLSFELDG